MAAKIAKVVVAAGHGGSDPGAVAAGKFKESVMALVVVKAVNTELKKYKNINIRMARTSDINQSITKKVNIANDFDADLALDIHFNAGGGDGAEVWATYAGGYGTTLGNNILAEFEKIGQNSRGVKYKTENGKDYFGFIRMTDMPAVIVECGFIDNAKDRKLFDTVKEQQELGVAIAKGIIKTLKQMGFENAGELKSTAKKKYSGVFPKLPSRGYFKSGDSGTQVKRLQKFLNWAVNAGLKVDGDLGSKTIAAVKKFQKAYGLTQDGKFGKKSLAKAKKIKK